MQNNTKKNTNAMISDALCQKDPVVLVLTDFNSSNQEEIKLLKKKFENQQKGYAKYLTKKQELLIQHKKTDSSFKIPLELMYDPLGYVSMEFRNIYDIALTAVKQNGYAIIYVPEEILDETIVTEAIKNNGINITHTQFTKFYKERHLNLLAAQYGASLEFINEDFRNDKEIVLQAIKNKSDYNRWRKDYYKLIRDETLRKDKEICLIVVKETGCMLGAMPDEIRDDKDVVIKQFTQTNSL
ncbi:hypothetical protein ABK040_005646 [Willaertia magna]